MSLQRTPPLMFHTFSQIHNSSLADAAVCTSSASPFLFCTHTVSIIVCSLKNKKKSLHGKMLIREMVFENPFLHIHIILPCRLFYFTFSFVLPYCSSTAVSVSSIPAVSDSSVSLSSEKRYGAGSTAAPLISSWKCRWLPVESPVVPLRPIC